MTAIEKKYQETGGPGSTLGLPAGAEKETPSGEGRYQEYERGFIFYHPSFGANVMEFEIARKWLDSSIGTTKIAGSITFIRDYLGFPVRDTQRTHEGGNVCYFERGMIIFRPDHGSFVLYGELYLGYRKGGGVELNSIGLPIEDQGITADGGAVVVFDFGNLYWSKKTNTFAVRGDILKRYRLMSGPDGNLGYPISNEEPVKNKNGTEVGRRSTFEFGNIFWNKTAGASPLRGDLVKLWLQEKDNLEILGFPKSDLMHSKNGVCIFANFENGVLAYYHSDESFKVFTRLGLKILSFQGFGQDNPIFGLATPQDLKVHVSVTNNKGFKFEALFNPSDTDHIVVNQIVTEVPVTDGNMILKLHFEGIDKDDTSDGDRLGVIHSECGIETAWNMDVPPIKERNGDFEVSYGIDPMVPIDAKDSEHFRKNLFWSFKNSQATEHTLSREIYAATFSDVADGESWIFNPFNALYYELVHRKMAREGVCVGMSIEAVYALYRRSPANQFISQYPVENQIIREEILIKQGYQLGDKFIRFIAGKVLTDVMGKGLGITEFYNPVLCFEESKAFFEQENYSIICLSDGVFGAGHAVVPYKWDKSNPDEWKIFVANPNAPYKYHEKGKERFNVDGTIDDSVIYVNPKENTFRYLHKPEKNETWTGGTNPFTSGRMFSVPYHVFSTQPRTPFWEVLALLVGGILIIMADSGEVKQITDENNGPYYKNFKRQGKTVKGRNTSENNIPQLISLPVFDVPEEKMPGVFHYEEVIEYGQMYPIQFNIPFKAKSNPGLPLKINSSATVNISHLTTAIASKAFALHLTPTNFKSQVPADVSQSIAATQLRMAGSKSLTFNLLNKSADGYEWGIAGPASQIIVKSNPGKQASDIVTIDGLGTTGQAFTFQSSKGKKKVKPLTIQIMNTGVTGEHRMFELKNVRLEAGKSLTIQVANDCREIFLYNSDKAVSMDLNVFLNDFSSPILSRNQLQIQPDLLIKMEPVNWAVGQANIPVEWSVLKNIAGEVVTSFRM